MNIGLVLSGGMAKGAYQIGVLKALNACIPPHEIKYISCASVGVLNGYAYATGALDHAEEMWKHLCEGSDTRYFITQILRSSMLQQDISRLYDAERRISATSFYCALLDFNHRNIVYKDLSAVDHDKIPLYLKASVAMPVYNRSVTVDGTSYFDGAMIDNIPVYPLLKHHLDYIICVYFDDKSYKFEDTYFANKVIKITFPGNSVLKQSVSFSHAGIEDMIRAGYDRTKEILGTVLAEGYDNTSYICRKIEEINRNTRNPCLRITGDVMVANLNKITQKLTKRKIL